MRVIFASASYWVALLNPQDELHERAKKLSQTLSPFHIVTSEAVLLIVFDYFSAQGELLQKAASKLIENLYSHPRITVVAQTSILFQAGLLFHKYRPNQDWSLTECVSFKIMETQKITEALTYSSHFEQAGFVALLKEE